MTVVMQLEVVPYLHLYLGMLGQQSSINNSGVCIQYSVKCC